MKLRYIMFWIDCPQIRWEYGAYEYSFWWWLRRSTEWPNTILSLSRQLTPGAYEEIYPLLPKKKKGHWHLWSRESWGEFDCNEGKTIPKVERLD